MGRIARFDPYCTEGDISAAPSDEGAAYIRKNQ